MDSKKEIEQFRDHLMATVNAIVDSGDYDEEFDIVIGVNKKVIRIGLNADSYELLEELLTNELE